MFVLDCVYV